MPADFKAKLAPLSAPMPGYPKTSTYFLFVDLLKPRTFMVTGAILQVILCAVLPFRYAVVPACALLLNSAITTVIQVRSPKPNEFNRDVVPGRVSAQIPFPEGAAPGSTHGSRPASAPFVLFNLGVQWKHPLGLLAPGVAEIGDYFEQITKDLEERREELGLLGYQRWRADEKQSNNTINTTYFFRDIDAINQFAKGEVHRRAWDWFAARKAKYSHIGIFHEAFCVPANAYESVYVNCSPVSMGRISVRDPQSKGEGEGEGGEEKKPQWVNSLVQATSSVWKTQYSRMSRDELGALKDLD